MSVLRAGVIALGWALAAATAQAQSGPGLYLEAGQARHNGVATRTLTAGLRMPTGVSFFSGRLQLAVDAYASHWHTDALPGQREDFLQLGLVPMLRWYFGENRSGWFVEAGVGASYLFDDFRTHERVFGSRWNFSDHLGVGTRFGAQQRHEIGLYVKHVSNAGLASPCLQPQ